MEIRAVAYATLLGCLIWLGRILIQNVSWFSSRHLFRRGEQVAMAKSAVALFCSGLFLGYLAIRQWGGVPYTEADLIPTVCLLGLLGWAIHAWQSAAIDGIRRRRNPQHLTKR